MDQDNDKYLADVAKRMAEISFDDEPENVEAKAKVRAKVKALPAQGERALIVNQKGEVVVSAANLARVLSTDPFYRDAIWFDSFYRRIMFTDRGGRSRGWEDGDTIDLMVYLQQMAAFQTVSQRMVAEAVEHFAKSRVRNEPKDWLKGLRWDGRPRIAHFFVDALGAERSPYVEAVGSNFWRALAARILEPGCKFDCMVVLEGAQGRGKSSALEIIGGRWYAEVGARFGTVDFYQALAGKLLIEIAELDSFSRSGVTSVKRVLSGRTDTYRASYGRMVQDYPRTTVFVGTTNEDEYLEDATGGRRFWPIKVGSIDLAMIRDHRDQLFAEAMHDYRLGLPWHEVPESAADVQASRRRQDPWADVIEHYLNDPVRSAVTHFSIQTIAKDALGLDAGRIDRGPAMRVAEVLRRFGLEKKDSSYLGVKGKYWVREGGGGSGR